MVSFSDVTIYEPDADMIFNYLMVSALANATDIIEKKNLKATGGTSYIHMLEKIQFTSQKGRHIWIDTLHCHICTHVC